MFGIFDFWLFLLAGLALNITPGPDTAFVVAQSARGDLRRGIMAALGIGGGCFVHIAAAAIGLSAIIAASSMAFTLIKLVGAAYLVYLGVTMLLASSRSRAGEGVAALVPVDAEAELGSPFWQGFWTNVLNPKVALFFLAFLPQFIDPAAARPWVAFVLLGLVFNTTGTLWNAGVALATAGFTRSLAGAPRIKLLLDRAIGLVFIGLGVKLAFDQR